MKLLENRVAIVTGAARGVGARIAEVLVESGARVVMTDLLVEEGEAAAAAIGDTALFSRLDVTSESDWTRVVEKTRNDFGRIDVLVNNAAVLHMGTIENTPPETFQRVMDVNTKGPYLGTRAVLETMKAQQRGSIVQIASIDGLLGMNGVTAYAASKWGLRGFTKSAAIELGRDGIRINSICPAGGNAAMFGPWLPKMMDFLDQTEAYANNRGIPGTVSLDAIAQGVLYLASDMSAHVTGIDLPIDGGATAGRYIEGFSSL